MGLIVGSSCGGIGDNLIFTPIFKKIKDATIELKEHPKARNVSSLFNGMAKVSFVENPRGCPEIKRTGHIAQNKLDGLGITDVNCIPWILLTEEEKENAKKFLSKNYDFDNGKPLIAFNPHNNVDGAADNEKALYRRYGNWDFILEQYAKKYRILQFGLSKNFIPHKGCDHVVDLDLRMLSACYHWIGRYIGIDTGDYHLMIAAGGFSDVLVPPTSYFYSHLEWHYRPELWKEEPVRVRYHLFENAESILNYV